MPVTYDMNNHHKGDTFNTLQFTMLNTDGLTPINLTGMGIKSQFRSDWKKGVLVKELNIGTGITVTDALNGVFQIDPFILDWNPSNYYYDVEFTFVDARVVTYIEGLIKIMQDVTYE